jgi:ubiquitin-protein ligase
MSKRISTTASSRLRQDYLRLMRDPVPYITATPLPSNILEWHYVVKGPEESPYEGVLTRLTILQLADTGEILVYTVLYGTPKNSLYWRR